MTQTAIEKPQIDAMYSTFVRTRINIYTFMGGLLRAAKIGFIAV